MIPLPPSQVCPKAQQITSHIQNPKSLNAEEGNCNIGLFAVTLDYQGCLLHHHLVYLTSDLCLHNIVPLLKRISPTTPSFGVFCFHLCHIQSHISLPPFHPLPRSLSDPSHSLGVLQSQSFHCQPKDGEVNQPQGELTPKYPNEKQKMCGVISPYLPLRIMGRQLELLKSLIFKVFMWHIFRKKQKRIIYTALKDIILGTIKFDSISVSSFALQGRHRPRLQGGASTSPISCIVSPYL